MSSLSPVGRSAAARKNDRVSLCMFTFSDGRRCRTPRIRNHPHFCFYHAQKEARARTAQKLGKDLTYFFSGDYLSACDLSTALARLIPAVVRGDVKPKTAHTVAYLLQTLMQAIHISQHEYINAFGSDGWRKSVRNSVNDNYDYRFPPDPEQSESLQPQPQPAQPQTQAQQPASAPPSNPLQPPVVAHAGIYPACPEHLGDPVGRGEAFRSASPPKATPPQPAEIPASCHSERSEEPASSHSTAPSPTSAHAPQTPAAHAARSFPASHPERSEGSCLDPAASTTGEIHPIPATQFARSVAPAAQPNNPQQTYPSTPQPAPNRDAYSSISTTVAACS
jgi:hypothetical protein